MDTGLVMVVDHESASRFRISVLLASENVEVMCAASAQEAEWLLGEGRFDLLITDLHLTSQKRMEGLGLISAAKRIDPRMKLVLVTGSASLAIQREVGRIGIADLWQKPVTYEQMIQRVRALGIPVVGPFADYTDQRG